MIRFAFLAVVALVGSPLFAGDCPTPKPLNCKRLHTLAQQRHCLEAKTEAAPVAAPCKAEPCIHTDCLPVNCLPVDCTPTEKVVTAFLPAPAPAPHGEWLAGGGPLYQAGWGLQAVVGYKFASGWQLMGGPNWVRHDATHGVIPCAPSNGHDSHNKGGDHDSHGGACAPIGYSVPAASPWGGTVLLTHGF